MLANLMRAFKFSINQMAGLAIQHLERNLSFLEAQTALRLRNSAPVKKANPFLIAFDAIELGRITDFQWSAWYSGTDLCSAIASDPVVEGGFCEELLAHAIHGHLISGHSTHVVFPDAMALRFDPILRNVESEVAFCGERVLHVLRYTDNVTAWLSLFGVTLRTASHAGSFEIGFCTTALSAENKEWTQEQLDGMINEATCVFAAALDGEGYLIWEL